MDQFCHALTGGGDGGRRGMETSEDSRAQDASHAVLLALDAERHKSTLDPVFGWLAANAPAIHEARGRASCSPAGYPGSLAVENEEDRA